MQHVDGRSIQHVFAGSSESAERGRGECADIEPAIDGRIVKPSVGDAIGPYRDLRPRAVGGEARSRRIGPRPQGSDCAARLVDVNAGYLPAADNRIGNSARAGTDHLCRGRKACRKSNSTENGDAAERPMSIAHGRGRRHIQDSRYSRDPGCLWRACNRPDTRIPSGSGVPLPPISRDTDARRRCPCN